MIDKRSAQKLLNMMNSEKYSVKHIAKKIEEETRKEVEENYEYIARSAVDRFYEAYDPNSYSRSLRLYDAYKVTVNDKEWSIEYDSSYLEGAYGKYTRYIYGLAYNQGYHGGAKKGPGHPAPGTPYWHAFEKNEWVGPAQKTTSIKKMIDKDVKEYTKKAVDKMQKDFDAEIEKRINELKAQIIKTFKL